MSEHPVLRLLLPGAHDQLRGGAEGRAERPLDARLVPAALAAWAWSAAALGLPLAVLAGAALGAVVGAAVCASRSRSQSRTRGGARGARAGVALVLVVVAAVAVSVGAARLERSSGLLQPLAEQQATAVVQGVATSDAVRVRPDPARPWADSRPRWVLRLAARSVTGRGSTSPARAEVLVVGGGGWDAVRRGDVVSATGRLQPTGPADPAAAVLLAVRAPDVSAPTGWAARTGQRLREGLVRACAPLPPDARGLLPGLVVGDTTALPDDLSTAMRATGLTHLTSVSGGNTALVAGAVLALATAAGVPRGPRLLLTGGGLLAYAALAGGEPSVLRAAAMGLAAVVGTLTARGGGGLPALALAVVVLLVADPWLGRQAGFALSVLATGALLLLAPAWAAALARPLLRGRVPGRRAAPVRDAVVVAVSAAVAVPLAAQVVCAPVVLLLAPGVPLLAVPANALAGPAVAPATLLGLLAALAEPLGPAGRAVAWASAHTGGLAAGWVAQVARAGAGSPAAVLPWPQGPLPAAGLALATAAVLAAGSAVRRARGRRRG